MHRSTQSDNKTTSNNTTKANQRIQSEIQSKRKTKKVERTKKEYINANYTGAKTPLLHIALTNHTTQQTKKIKFHNTNTNRLHERKSLKANASSKHLKNAKASKQDRRRNKYQHHPHPSTREPKKESKTYTVLLIYTVKHTITAHSKNLKKTTETHHRQKNFQSARHTPAQSHKTEKN